MTPQQGVDDPRPRARPDPRTREVPAGPGDAGLRDRPELNEGSAGQRQMSNKRLAKGIALAALVAVIVFVIAAVF